MGYQAGVDAYHGALREIDITALTHHYTDGLAYFHDRFVPHIRRRLSALTGGVWRLDDFVAYAAGSDVDLMTHIVEAVSVDGPVSLFPGDWYGFLVGTSQRSSISWTAESAGSMACLCVPSVRNGHITREMVGYLDEAESCLLNINLFPTLAADDRRDVAAALSPIMERSILSISFSRGFGLTASQLGVALIHKDHPYRARFDTRWRWLTYFYNHIAARAFEAIDLERMQAIDDQRRAWVSAWLRQRDLPVVDSGTYYVKSFRPDGPVPERLTPLVRGDVIRLCFKPPMT